MKNRLLFIISLSVSIRFVYAQIKVDTVFVNESGITMLFPKNVSVAVVNADKDFSCTKEGKQVIIKAKKVSKRISPMSVVYGDDVFFISIVKYKENPDSLIHDFRESVIATKNEKINKDSEKLEAERQKELIKRKMDEMLFEKKELTTIGDIKGNIIFKLSNIKIDDEYVYFRFNLKNGSNMDFNIDYVRFQALEKVKSSDNDSDENQMGDEDIVPYISSPIGVVGKRKDEYLLYAIPVFGLGDRGGYKVTLKEKKGNRAIRLIIKAKDIDKAERFK